MLSELTYYPVVGTG